MLVQEIVVNEKNVEFCLMTRAIFYYRICNKQLIRIVIYVVDDDKKRY